MDRIYILNPAADRGTAPHKLASLLQGQNAKVWETANPGAAIRLAHEAARAGVTTVVACGGDGTVGEVAAGLLGSESTLAVLPLGTGNDFARTLGFGPSLSAAFEALNVGKTVDLDLIRWTAGGQTGISANICGCGFDATVAARVNEGFRMLRGPAAYLAAVLSTLRTFRATELTLTLDGETVEIKAMLCAVANAKTYGGGMRIAPGADISDGQLDVVIVGDVSRSEFLRAFPSVFKGTHLSHPKVFTRRARRVRIESLSPVLVLADGEIIGTTPVGFEILPSALKVIVQ